MKLNARSILIIFILFVFTIISIVFIYSFTFSDMQSGNKANLQSIKLSPNYRNSCAYARTSDEAAFCISRASLKASKKQVFWAAATFFSGTCGTIGILITIFYTIKAVQAAQASALAAINQAKVAERAIDSADRPWILFDLLVNKVTKLEDGQISIGLTVQLNNYGRSPAINVTTGVKAFFPIGKYEEGQIFNPEFEKNLVYQIYDQEMEKWSSDRGHLIASDRQLVIRTGATVNVIDHWRSGGPLGRQVTIFISVQATYRSPLWATDHVARTAVTYMLNACNNGGPSITEVNIVDPSTTYTAISIGLLGRTT